MHPYNVQSTNKAQVQLWKLSDGNFRILQDGSYTTLLNGSGYILIKEKIVPLFKKLNSEELTLIHRKIIDQDTKEENLNYFELIIKNSITPENIDFLNSNGLKAWHYGEQTLFISRELKKLLEAVVGQELEFSEGFSLFA